MEPTPEIPHGIRYNLTLHNKYNERIFGFDNAHAVSIRGNKKYKGRIVQYDHVHTTATDKGRYYEFVSAGQLLQDFFVEIKKY